MFTAGRPPEAPWRDPGVLAGLAAIGGTAVLDAGIQVQITGAYAVGAIVASMLTVARRTAAVGVVAVAVALLGGVWGDNLGSRQWLVRALLCLVLAVLGVVSAEIRDRREARLRRIVLIAETAQRALLRPVPGIVGFVGAAARYVSAAQDALVGGDLYDLAETPYGVRLVVGDVRGKGLEAVQTAAAAVGAFRQAAYHEEDLVRLASVVDETVSRVIGAEDFVTAVFVELSGDTITLVNCGHPAPLLIRSGVPRLLDPADPSPPLGLAPRPTPDAFPWEPGDRVLIHTDGLVEARDPWGEFFPLERYAGSLGEGSPEEALERLLGDLGRFTRAEPGDDIAMVLLENRVGSRADA